MSETLREAIERLAEEWERIADALLRVLVPQDYESAAIRGCASDLRATLAEHPATPAEERCECRGMDERPGCNHHGTPTPAEVAEGEREALAGVLAAHRAIVSGDVDGWHVICHCGFKAPGVDTTAHIAGALSDWLRDHDAALTAKARAEALREAADEWPGLREAGNVAVWLQARADREAST